jgi:pyrophosphatase PpaX
LKSEGLKVAVVSRNSIECVQKSIRVSDLHDHIDLIVGRESTEKTKPDPSPLLYALKIFSITPSEAFFIGDTRHDSMAAERAGMPFIMFNRRKTPYNGLQVDSLGNTLLIVRAHKN